MYTHTRSGKQGLQWRKRQGRQIEGEKDERSAMQFQVQAGVPGKKTSGAPNWRRKERKGRYAVSSANRCSREENVRGAKLTEKRTRDAPCSFKCKQGLQRRKRQGRQIDGEKENKSLNCQTYFPFGLKIINVVFLNSIIMILVSFTFLLYSTTPRLCRPWSHRGKKLVITSWQMEKEVNTAPHHLHSPKGPGRPLATNWVQMEKPIRTFVNMNCFI